MSIDHRLFIPLLLVSLLALASVGLACARWLFFASAYLDSDYTKARSGEALLILGMIAALMLAFFLLHGARIALGEPEGWMPVSILSAKALGGISPSAPESLASTAWWVHAMVLLVFMNLLPRSKHMHILTAIPNCYFRSLDKPNV